MAVAGSQISVARRLGKSKCDQILAESEKELVEVLSALEIRKLLRVEVLILDDFALTAMDTQDTAAVYEIIVERHRRATTIITSNREPNEWIALMADPLLAQSAIDRPPVPLTS